jgi:hypothetical protein
VRLSQPAHLTRLKYNHVPKGIEIVARVKRSNLMVDGTSMAQAMESDRKKISTNFLKDC